MSNEKCDQCGGNAENGTTACPKCRFSEVDRIHRNEVIDSVTFFVVGVAVGMVVLHVMHQFT